MILLSYKDLETQAKEVLTAIGTLFQCPLAEEADVVEAQAKEIEAWYSNVLYLLPIAEKYYRKEQAKLLESYKKEAVSKGLKGTDYEKEIYINDKASEYRELRDMMENMAKAIGQRISLAQSIIKKGKSNELSQ